MNSCVWVFCSTAELSIWRCSEISCSKIFSTSGKHLWCSLFSWNENLKFENCVKVDFFKDLFVENLPRFIHRVTILQKNVWIDICQKGLVVETSLDLVYILPYYFLLSSFYLLLLSNQNQSVYSFVFHISSKFMTEKEKKYFSLVICVLCVMSCSEIFLPRMAFLSILWVVTKNFFLSPTIVVTFGKH